MLPTAPYLIVAFAVAPGTPNGRAIINQIERGMPLPAGKIPVALPVADTYMISCPKNDPDTPFQDIAVYLQQQDQNFGGVLLWFLQVCRSNEIAGL